jgi:hypothetical protein
MTTKPNEEILDNGAEGKPFSFAIDIKTAGNLRPEKRVNYLFLQC